MNLNIPDTRQRILARRLDDGLEIVAADAATEFDVSLDTIRRDILALEAEGKAHRVRGGAVPISKPVAPLHSRLAGAGGINPNIAHATISQIGDASTLLVDGGSTTLGLIAHLSNFTGRLVMTPSPWVAIACQENDIDVFLLGGKLSARGGIAVGGLALGKVADVTADIAILGACGIDAEFGLSTDDYEEAQMKAAMHSAAARTFVVTGAEKIGKRARHHTLHMNQIDLLITDADQGATELLTRSGDRVITV
ncbi:DeoR/GlpR family DNA-binding transcription regulator [Yoonia maritima]|uniref:DeoR/GlpR family DNA-binding transcription regulator n=1 Tax=Yoonia maritima TaxID=1435347 RepID=UPI000D100507|nr:DeoR/GlpR family DNA-binding transcription regulator [Yoonia maritima]